MAIMVNRVAIANAQNVIPISAMTLKTIPTYTPATSDIFSSALSRFLTNLFFSCFRDELAASPQSRLTLRARCFPCGEVMV